MRRTRSKSAARHRDTPTKCARAPSCPSDRPRPNRNRTARVAPHRAQSIPPYRAVKRSLRTYQPAHEEALGHNARNHAIGLIANALLEQLEQLELRRFARGFFSGAFRGRCMVGNARQGRFQTRGLTRAAEKRHFQHAMHHKVGIARMGLVEVRYACSRARSAPRTNQRTPARFIARTTSDDTRNSCCAHARTRAPAGWRTDRLL